MYSDSNTVAAGIGSSSSATVNQRDEEKWTADVIKLKFKYEIAKKLFSVSQWLRQFLKLCMISMYKITCFNTAHWDTVFSHLCSAFLISSQSPLTRHILIAFKKHFIKYISSTLSTLNPQPI